MCGIFGIFNLDSKSLDISELLVPTKIMRHRGPDDEGYFLYNTVDRKHGFFSHFESTSPIRARYPILENTICADLGFGFRRLSIIDVTESGHQPMFFEERGVVIVFNGEIYNYLELRDELLNYGFSFETNSDTEVILKAYSLWGEKCVNKFNGMWAFAIWDTVQEKLFCSRDRFGIKPFYFIKSEKSFAFASEIKSLLGIIKPRENFRTLSKFFYNGVGDDTDQTFFEGIFQLKASHSLLLTKETFGTYQYYTINPKKTVLSFDESKEELKDLFYNSVSLRQRSDVPYGYALSGGIDSSSIVCTAANIGSNILKANTFSMIYPGSRVDESLFIKDVIDKTNFNSFFVSPSGADIMAELDRFVYHQEEPFAGLSYFGEYKLRELIKLNNVTVSLEGQGADELFTGYNNLIPYYFRDLIRKGKFAKLSSEISAFEKMFPTSLSKQVMRFIKDILINQGLKKPNNAIAYINYEFIFENYSPDYEPLDFRTDSSLNNELLRQLRKTSLPQQLIRADKNSMAFSVECRFPFLDYRIVEFAYSLPYHYKINKGTTKFILREAFKDVLPKSIYNRKDKIGFALPSEGWVDKKMVLFLKQLIDSFPEMESDLLDIKHFKSYYLSDRSDSVQNIDWRFWKTFSYLIWYNRFIKNPEIISK